MSGLALLATAALAAGCGGDDEKEALSKSEYVKQGNAICKKFNTVIEKDAEEAFADIQSRQDLTAEKARAFFDDALPKFDAVVADIDALAPPEGDEDTVKKIVEAGESDSAKIEEADDKEVVGFVLSESATPEFDDQAEAYGLTECGTQ